MLKTTTLFAGGERHYELVKSQLPTTHSWTNITVPLKPFLSSLRETAGRWVVFASGDPLFFGIGNTLKREFPDAELLVYPTFNSLQQLAHRLNLPYGTARVVTLTGRPWAAFDKVLIDGEPLIALLTDKVKTPATIAQRMVRFGYTSYTLHLGERLGGNRERIRTLSIDEAADSDFTHPNCIYLERLTSRVHQQGIADNEFDLLDGRPNMITKMPIRLASLAAIAIKQRSIFWDVGACTGSISVEAKLMQPLLDVHSFEIRQGSDTLVLGNAKRFGTPLSFYQGDFGNTDVTSLPRPDAVFLGGYGGRMEAILDKIDHYLLDSGIIGFNAVSDTSRQRFIMWAQLNGYTLLSTSTMQVDEHNPITILTIQKNKQ